MDIHYATEIAYKNGYEAGYKKAIEDMKNKNKKDICPVKEICKGDCTECKEI